MSDFDMQQNDRKISERETRLLKRERMFSEGINPYPYRFSRSHYVEEIQRNVAIFANGEKEVGICGKIYSIRSHGGSLFLDIADMTGKIQLYAKRDNLGKERFGFLQSYIDIGDFIGIQGSVFNTKKGELSILVNHFELLSKAFRPLPSEWYGLKDPEKRYRQRYIDLLLNKDVRSRFMRRTVIINAIRNYLQKDGFLEIETPILQPIYGGASAKPFTTHYESLKRDFYLRISNELYLKRALIGNLEKVFEFSRDFRNEGIDATHNPEFTMIEIYEAYKDYHDFMALTKELVLKANEVAENGSVIQWGGKEINLAGEWVVATMTDLFLQHTGVDILGASGEELLQYARGIGLDLPKTSSWGTLIDKIFGEKVEPHLINPTFVIDYPPDISPLAKQHREKKNLAERFELYIGTKEIANGFSELNDPVEQRNRFQLQLKMDRESDDEIHPLDEDFLLAQEYGMPPAAGVGIGIDRLVMLLTNALNIREVIMFPQLKDINDDRD